MNTTSKYKLYYSKVSIYLYSYLLVNLHIWLQRSFVTQDHQALHHQYLGTNEEHRIYNLERNKLIT